MFHTEAQTAQSEDRIVFTRADDFARQFFAAEIEGSDDAIARRQRLGQGAIELQMFLFRRQEWTLRDVEELRSVESDALRAESNGVLELFDQLDVRLQRELM